MMSEELIIGQKEKKIKKQKIVYCVVNHTKLNKFLIMNSENIDKKLMTPKQHNQSDLKQLNNLNLLANSLNLNQKSDNCQSINNQEITYKNNQHFANQIRYKEFAINHPSNFPSNNNNQIGLSLLLTQQTDIQQKNNQEQPAMSPTEVSSKSCEEKLVKMDSDLQNVNRAISKLEKDKIFYNYDKLLLVLIKSKNRYITLINKSQVD